MEQLEWPADLLRSFGGVEIFWCMDVRRSFLASQIWMVCCGGSSCSCSGTLELLTISI